MAFAFDHAERSGLPLIVVHAVHDPNAAERELADLQVAMDSWRLQFPSVQAECAVVGGSLGSVIDRMCHEDDLLVLGYHRHNPLLFNTLGWTGTSIVHNARCPVTVIQEPGGN
ncbi:MAG: Universal stress protein [Pseudonocardiales bacterium]|nr:Universal stress protein [Pseudonocardiales bacterium]